MATINWKHFFISFIVSSILIIGVVALTFREPKVRSLDKVEFISVTDSFLNVRANLSVENANFFSISSKHLAVKFTENDTELGQGDIESFSLKRTSTSGLSVVMKINYRQVIRSYKRNQSDSVEPSVAVKGMLMPAFFVNKISFKKKISKREMFSLLFKAVGDQLFGKVSGPRDKTI
jgi:LEA14-like dessication related protein